jgi:hypothetical protein
MLELQVGKLKIAISVENRVVSKIVFITTFFIPLVQQEGKTAAKTVRVTSPTMYLQKSWPSVPQCRTVSPLFFLKQELTCPLRHKQRGILWLYKSQRKATKRRKKDKESSIDRKTENER